MATADLHLVPSPAGKGRWALGRGAPPGAWQVRLEWRAGTRREHLDVQAVTLVRGQERQLAVDLAPLRPATLRGVVQLNGQPFGKDYVWLQGKHRYRLRTESDGRFEFRGTPGDYVLEAEVADDE